jgi:hypothetical protein
MLRADEPLIARRISGKAKVQTSASRQSREEQVDMVRHDNRRMQIDCLTIVMKTMLKNQRSRFAAEYEVRRCSKRDKQRAFIPLVVRQTAPVFVATEVRGRHEGGPRTRWYISLGHQSGAAKISRCGRTGLELWFVLVVRFRGQECPRHTIKSDTTIETVASRLYPCGGNRPSAGPRGSSACRYSRCGQESWMPQIWSLPAPR